MPSKKKAPTDWRTLANGYQDGQERSGLTLTAYRLGSLGGKREKGDYFTLDVATNSQEKKCGLH
jgi:hypothetical protein